MQINGSHYDYTNQAWTVDGKYQDCSHPAAMNCGCYCRLHAGEIANPANLPTASVVMADERDTAQWYTVNSQSEAVQSCITSLPVNEQKYCYQYGQLVNWARLPLEVRNNLRKALHHVREDAKAYESHC